jgi:altronate hydrolase
MICTFQNHSGWIPVFLRLNSLDNVAVVINELLAGSTMEVDDALIILRQSIPAGHKVALRDIPPENPVIKYGEVIGNATQFIHTGDHVHLHNLSSLRDTWGTEDKVE